MSCYCVDTNIISYILRKDKKLQDRVYREANEGAGVLIPPIAYYEIKRGLIEANATTKLRDFERLCSMIEVDYIDTETLDIAANIWAALIKAGRKLDDADILIAATCIAHDHTLVSANTRHFERIEGLKLVNWVE